MFSVLWGSIWLACFSLRSRQSTGAVLQTARNSYDSEYWWNSSIGPSDTSFFDMEPGCVFLQSLGYSDLTVTVCHVNDFQSARLDCMVDGISRWKTADRGSFCKDYMTYLGPAACSAPKARKSLQRALCRENPDSKTHSPKAWQAWNSLSNWDVMLAL